MDVYCWGCKDFVPNAINDVPPSAELEPIAMNASVTALACGSTHSIAVIDATSILGWGDASIGQTFCGAKNGRKPQQSDLQSLLGPNYRIVGVSCGSRHSILWTEDGRAVSAGCNFNAQLTYDFGSSNYKQHHFDPRVIINLPLRMKVKSVACGARHSMFLLENGTVAAVGSNSNGQLGIVGPLRDCEVAVVVSDLHNVIDIRCGEAYTVALLEDGHVMQWGSKMACRGKTDTVHPVLVQGLENVVSVRCGGSHSLALNCDGLLMSWGDNTRGQLGHNDESSNPSAVLDLQNVIHFGCGESFSAAVVEDGRLFMWGSNLNCVMHAKPGGLFNCPTHVMLPQPIHAVACGGWHVAALSRSGVTWQPKLFSVIEAWTSEQNEFENSKNELIETEDVLQQLEKETVVAELTTVQEDVWATRTSASESESYGGVESTTTNNSNNNTFAPTQFATKQTIEMVANQSQNETIEHSQRQQQSSVSQAPPPLDRRRSTEFITNDRGHLLRRPSSSISRPKTAGTAIETFRLRSVNEKPQMEDHVQTAATTVVEKQPDRTISRARATLNEARARSSSSSLVASRDSSPVRSEEATAVPAIIRAKITGKSSKSSRQSSDKSLPPIISLPGRKPGFSSGSSWRK